MEKLGIGKNQKKQFNEKDLYEIEKAEIMNALKQIKIKEKYEVLTKKYRLNEYYSPLSI